MQVQTGVISFRSPTGEIFDYEEPIFEEFDDEEIENTDTECTFNPFDDFISYIATKISEQGCV